MSVARFKIVSRFSDDAQAYRTVQEISCRCGATHALTCAKSAMPDHTAALRFTQHGWQVGRRATDDRCPACVAMEAGDRKAKHASEPSKSKDPVVMQKPVAAEPPPEPSRIDKRRIIDALNERYDHALGCYVEAWTDVRVATALNVPRAWVSSLREEFFGAEQSELQVKVAAEAATLSRRASEIEERALAVASDAEQLRHDAQALAKKAVAL